MAQEITATLSLAASKSNLSLSRSVTVKPDLTGTHFDHRAKDIPTTAGGTALGFSGIGTAGYAYFRNLDATNFVQVGVQVSGTFYPLVKLKAGEAAVLRLATSSVYALADTATVTLEFAVLED